MYQSTYKRVYLLEWLWKSWTRVPQKTGRKTKSKSAPFETEGCGTRPVNQNYPCDIIPEP